MQKVTTILHDDVDGTPSTDNPTVRTRRFSLDDLIYELDLHDDHYEQLGKDLERWIQVARSAPRRKALSTPVHPGAARSRERREETARIRSWLLDNGHTTTGFGRLRASDVELYNQAHL